MEAWSPGRSWSWPVRRAPGTGHRAAGTGHRAPGTGHRAPGTGHRAPGTGHRAPGTGKTILAQQMCFARATAEHKCIYYTTMSEPHNKLVRHLKDFAFFDPESLGPKVEYIHMSDLFGASRQDGLEALTSEIVRKTLDEKPSIVVVDSAKMLGDFTNKRELRRALYDLTGRFARTGAVLLLLGEYTPEELRSEVVFSLADSIIQLKYKAREPIDRRWLRIIKMRGGNHRSGKHTFRIGPRGVEVFPRIETLVPQPEAPLSSQIPSGIPGLDDLMGGGARQSDASLVTGPSGVGKTIFGLRWLVQGIEREKTAFTSASRTPVLSWPAWPPVSAGISRPTAIPGSS
jgi:circadian clock protein KaiC